MARVMIEQDPPAAKAALEAILKANPSHVPAHLLLAELALDDRQRDEARASVKKALDINSNSLEARALDAAIAYLEARTGEQQPLDAPWNYQGMGNNGVQSIAVTVRSADGLLP